MTPNQQTANRRTRLAAIAAGAALALGALGVAASEQRDATLMSDDPTTTIAPAPGGDSGDHHHTVVRRTLIGRRDRR